MHCERTCPVSAYTEVLLFNKLGASREGLVNRFIMSNEQYIVVCYMYARVQQCGFTMWSIFKYILKLHKGSK